MAKANKRACPDPLVSVADIQKVFASFCKKEGSWDLYALLFKTSSRKTWKNAPDSTFLAGNVSQLCLGFFKLSNNGVMASKKIRLALEKLQHETHRLNFSQHHDGEFFDMVDQQVRIACSMFRDLKTSPCKYATCMRKASTSEKETVDGVLQHLVVTDAVSEVGVTSEKPPKPEKLKVDKSPEKPAKQVSIFKRVLQKQASDPSSPAKSIKEQAVAASFEPHSSNPHAMSSSGVTTPHEKLETSNANAACGVTVAHADLGILDLEADEAEELKDWLLQKTTVKMKKKKKGQKASAKGQKPALKKPALKKPALKKPAAVQSKKTEKKKQKETLVTPENKKGSCKVSFKKRKCDSGYHSAKLRAKKDGKSLEEACAAGSAAAAKMAAEIDAGLVTDPNL